MRFKKKLGKRHFLVEGFEGEMQLLSGEEDILLKMISETDGDVLEIGTGDGVFIVIAALENPNKEFLIVDNGEWKQGGGLENLKNNMEKHEVSIKVRHGDSRILVPELNRQFGLIFIDGSHYYEVVKEDAVNSWKLLADGGLLVFHDFNQMHSGVVAAVEDFAFEVKREIRKFKDCSFAVLRK